LILYLEGNKKEELDFDLRRIMSEKCALAAAINLTYASALVRKCLVAQKARGEAGSGIVSIEKEEFFRSRGTMPVDVQFYSINLGKELPGRIAIGHNRYATQGDFSSLENIQPLLIRDSKYGPIAIAHNGTLVNYQRIKNELVKNGSVFCSTTDTEVLVHLIITSGKKTIEEAIKYALGRIEAAYSLLILTQDKLVAIRDKFGVRPLNIAEFGEGYLVCSETHIFDQLGATNLKSVGPGEMVIFEKGKKHPGCVQYAKPDEHFCIFEGIYFSNPRTRHKNVYHEDFREKLGEEIVRENRDDIKGDIVIPILDSGKHAAIGLAKAVGVKYEEVLQRSHGYKQSRSFTSPTVEEREEVVIGKFHLRKDKIFNRDVIVVDDSIVRSTTIKIIVRMLRAAGARTIVVCIASPPITNICPNGMDYQDTDQLIAYSKTIEEIRKNVGADKLIYLTLEGLIKVVKKTYDCGICTGCFGGKYPVEPSETKKF
jgi:amidophosphoribosyltransferase